MRSLHFPRGAKFSSSRPNSARADHVTRAWFLKPAAARRTRSANRANMPANLLQPPQIMQISPSKLMQSGKIIYMHLDYAFVKPVTSYGHRLDIINYASSVCSGGTQTGLLHLSQHGCHGIHTKRTEDSPED